jgi:arabinofuranosyltransferase
MTGAALVDGSDATTGEPGDWSRMTETLGRRIEGRERWVEAFLYVSALIVGWWVRFAQDDAFITFRFARNLARGHGLVFNPGERVEGYTNFLWTWIMVIPEKLGWNTPIFAQVLSLVFMVATVAVFLRFADRVLGNHRMALVAGFALVANMTFLGYATGGLETMMQTFFIMGVAALLVPVRGGGADEHLVARRLVAGLLGGLAILTRLDSTVLVAAWFCVHLWPVIRERTDGRASRLLVGVVTLGGPVLLVVVPWLVWKYDYYGSIVPNTFYAKSASNPLIPFLYGVIYLLSFFASYFAFVFIRRYRRLGTGFFALPGTKAAFAVVPVWFLYICVVGGDFMEFRFIVPVIPVLALLAGYLIDHYRRPIRHTLLIALLLFVSLLHRVLPGATFPVLTFTDINHWPNESQTTWFAMGKLLGSTFPGGIDAAGQPSIALQPLGVISYFSDLPAVDMLGLTDKWVARNGDPIPIYYPGHVRMAPVHYLVDRKVNLVIGEPLVNDVVPGRTSYLLSDLVTLWSVADLRQLPDTAKVIEVPLAGNKVWTVLYLTPNDKVDAAIEKNGWATFPIEKRCDTSDFGWLLRTASKKTCSTG